MVAKEAATDAAAAAPARVALTHSLESHKGRRRRKEQAVLKATRAERGVSFWRMLLAPNAFLSLPLPRFTQKRLSILEAFPFF